MLRKLDTTLIKLTDQERRELRDRIIQAINDQPSHMSPDFDGPVAYELSVLNWDLCSDMAGTPHLFDEWWLTRHTDIV